MHKIITSTATTGHHSVVCLCVSYLPAMRPWEKSEGREVVAVLKASYFQPTVASLSSPKYFFISKFRAWLSPPTLL